MGMLLAFCGLMTALCFGGLMFPELSDDPLSRRLAVGGIVVAVVCGVLFILEIGSWV